MKSRNNDNLEAWDGRFTHGQIQDIIAMSLMADKIGIKLHDVLNRFPPLSKTSVKGANSGYLSQTIMKCPDCGKKLNISEIAKHSKKYKEGFRTYLLCGAACCSSKGCGYEKFSRSTIQELYQKKEIE